MIIRNDHRAKRRISLVWALLPLGMVAALLFAFWPQEPEIERYDLICSAEDTVQVPIEDSEKARHYFLVGQDSFINGETWSSAAARTGKYSSAPRKARPYGLGYHFRGLKAGEKYEVSVWRKKGFQAGELIFDGDWGEYASAQPSGNSEAEWEELSLKFEVPWYVDEGEAKVYCYHPGPEYVFFDDLAIRRLKAGVLERRGNLPLDSVTSINLVIEDAPYQKLQRKRIQALRQGVLVTGNNDFVNARLESGGKRYDAKVRLKGDWTDHLLGDKWSFRIKLDQGQSWNRLTTFSVQNPYTRAFLLEYLFHHWLEKEGLLAPKYDFVHLSINGESRGLYALEEHFVKTLLERNQRREGPIMKLVEDGFWDAQQQFGQENVEDLEERLSVFASAEVDAFSGGKILKDTLARQQFLNGQALMKRYKGGNADVWEVFDAEKVAKYFAIVDLLKAHHAFIWHNQRWYYNPLLDKLEPIGFDGFTETGPLLWIKKPFIGYAHNFRYLQPAYKGLMFERFFNNVAFMERYVHYLEKFSRKSYLDALMTDWQAELGLREKLIQNEWPEYEFDREFVHRQGRLIRMVLRPLPGTSLKVYRSENKEGRQRYQVFNYHGLPVRLLGVGKKEKLLTKLDSALVIPAYKPDFPAEMAEFLLERNAKWLHFEVPGLDSSFRVEVLPYPAPVKAPLSEAYFADREPKNNGIWTVDRENKILTIPRGKYKVEQDLVVPAGFRLRLEAGADLDLVGGAAFVSRSEVKSLGRAGLPVRIHSSDGSGRGFSVLQVPDGQKCEFIYTVFEGLRNFDQGGWVHTGAVSLYESEAFFSHCRFVQNHCEDALNVVRSVFTLDKCHFAATAGDGLDADFCTASILGTSFFETGNDAMDFSGSTVYIDRCQVDGSGDKGLSLGEDSKATVSTLSIVNSEQGVASKDLSEAKIESLVLENVKQGLAVYQKKPEYGPASLEIIDLKEEDVRKLYQVQKGSVLLLEGTSIEGK